MLYGRDLERDRIGALVDAARDSRSGALVLRGEPGIGKTALLDDARQRASGMHVLAARGVRSESELPFAALHQLLRPAFGLLDQLPGAQAAALNGALGLGGSATQEPFLVFAACLSLLSELADQQPVLCLVDDAHWLDSSSADALRFVARRLDAEGIVLLFAARDGEVRAFEAADVPSLQLYGLDVEAAAELLTQHARAPASTVRDRLVEQTLGNALALIELPAALSDAQLAGDEPLPEALPLTHQVESVFLERVRRLPDDSQRLLLVIAADDSENPALVARAGANLGVNVDALDAAEQAGLVSVSGTRLEFRIRLLYGEHLRRARRPSDARTHLRAAVEGFERLRADPWAERARGELRATGETARRRDPSTRGQLTPQELQIARYAAEGLANKEIAAQMFLSKRTIDYHLRNIYVKLGIASRTQLAGLRLSDDAPVRNAAAGPV